MRLLLLWTLATEFFEPAAPASRSGPRLNLFQMGQSVHTLGHGEQNWEWRREGERGGERTNTNCKVYTMS